MASVLLDDPCSVASVPSGVVMGEVAVAKLRCATPKRVRPLLVALGFLPADLMVVLGFPPADLKVVLGFPPAGLKVVLGLPPADLMVVLGLLHVDDQRSAWRGDSA